MPALGTVAEASPSEPYLGVILEFDLAVMREVMAELDTPPKPRDHLGWGVFVTDFDGPLADCALSAWSVSSTRPRQCPCSIPPSCARSVTGS
jgi:hypothetical protein